MKNLSNRIMYGPLPMFATPGNEGGGGGAGGQEPGDDADTGLDLSDDDLNLDLDTDTDPLLEGVEGEDGINVDDDSYIDKLFEPDEEDDDDNSGNGDDLDAGDSPEAQAKLAKDLKDAIGALTIPETAIPDGFDPTDSKQMRDLLGTVQKSTVQETMKIMWQPIAAAMQQTIVRLRQEIKAEVNDGVGSNSLNQMLNKAIPAYATSPGLRAMADTVIARAKIKYRGDNTKIVAATRKALIGAGVPIQGKGKGKPGAGGNTNGRGRTAASKTNDVLDMFAKLPTRVQAQPNARLANRMQSGNK
jgi:hypothetical protein